MAATYHLICFDCECYLWLGKVYSRDPEGRALPATTFDGIYKPEEGRWHRRDEYFGAVVEAFLVQHRNHELRFVPEGVDELIETATRPVQPVDVRELLQAQATVEVDAESELHEWKLRGRWAKN